MSSSENPLDNPVYHSLKIRHARFAQSNGLALRFDPEVAPFAGLREQSPEAYSALAQLLAPGEFALLSLNSEPQLPPDWKLLRLVMGDQMVCIGPISAPSDFPLIPLTASDVPEMLDLTALTDPGPFRRRTIELGSYLGIRPENDTAGTRLAAMAGERMAFNGYGGPCYTEISAVCTHPDFRGRGYAQALVAAIAAGIRARGETPFLHVLSTNASAIRVYQRLGFAFRQQMHFTAALPPQPQ